MNEDEMTDAPRGGETASTETAVEPRRTAEDLISSMGKEAKWFKNQAQYHAWKATNTLGVDSISHRIEQRAYEQTYHKLTEWAMRLREHLLTDAEGGQS